MSTQIDQVIEFRCNTCWQTMQVGMEMENSSTSCLHCGSELAVPPATPERLREASEVVAVEAAPATAIGHEPSDAELQAIHLEESRLASGELDFSGFANASLTTRFFASLVDGLYILFTLAIGFAAVIVAGQFGVVQLGEAAQHRFDPTVLIILYFFPLIGAIVQWNLISTRGQTLGKMLFSIRMTTLDGRLPGFIHGVVLRNWLRNLLAFIPFFGLVDLLFIFGDAHRCIHDYLAGTRVVQC